VTAHAQIPGARQFHFTQSGENAPRAQFAVVRLTAAWAGDDLVGLEGPAGDDSPAPARDNSPAPAGDNSNRRPLERRLWVNYLKTRSEHPHLTFDTYTAHFERLREMKNLLQAQYPETIPLPRFKWQKSFHDHIIRNERDYFNHLNYIYINPVKHGLVDDPEDWPFMWIEGMPEPRRSTQSGTRAMQ